MAETNERKNPYIRLLPILLAALILIFFAGNLSNITSSDQQNIITEAMEERINKDARDIAVQLKNATPKQQKDIMESYDFSLTEQDGILESLDFLKEMQETVEDAQKSLDDPKSDQTTRSISGMLYQTGIAGLEGGTFSLEHKVKSRLTDITLKTFKTQDNSFSSYSEIISSSFIIIITLGSLLSLILINFRRFFERKEANAQIEKCENWGDTLQYAHKRLLNEEKYMERLNIANLTSGIIIAGLGVLWFLFFVFPLDRVVEFDSFINFIATYWPRFGIVIIVGIFAIFFLRLYTKTIRRIDRNRNEITNIELRLTSGLMLCDEKDRGRLKSLANELSKEERNFVLDKNESSAILDTDKLVEIASKFTPKIGF